MEGYGTKMQAWSPFTGGKKNIFTEPILVEIGEKYGKMQPKSLFDF